MAFPTTGLLDQFTRADAATLGANWAADPFNFGHTSPDITSNQCGGVANESAYWSAATFGPDCETYITFAVVESVEYIIGIRLQAPATAGVDGYAVIVDPSATPDANGINRVDNGAFTQLGASISQTWANGDAIGLEAIGSAITLYRKPSGGSWGSLGSRTDATYGSAGNISAPYTVDTATRLDDFGGGTVVAAASLVPRRNPYAHLIGR